MVTVSRPINGISTNGNEDLLNEDGTVMEFTSLSAATEFLREAGMTGDEIYSLTFDEVTND